ncbi:hypothetical protein BD289DRAFT_183337 [Coniella lustricola]|uniref:Transmembrane protein n=1 Tax=Coniella lustricola TaxID=2025994 RepID=A0A2T2ZT75_9PEZI|nr:hypothetical protein BD289DRAFT_183337 [Coniella lustricola]
MVDGGKGGQTQQMGHACRRHSVEFFWGMGMGMRRLMGMFWWFDRIFVGFYEIWHVETCGCRDIVIPVILFFFSFFSFISGPDSANEVVLCWSAEDLVRAIRL